MRRTVLLAFGTFALGMDGFIMTGLLSDISGDFDVSLSLAGQLVTAFTLCYALAAPVCTAVLSSKPAKLVLLGALLVFTLGNGLSALSSSYPLLLVARAIAGIGAGIYMPMAATTAAALVEPEQRGRALGLVLGGLSIGTVLGMPAGLALAHLFGWRLTLWAVTGLGLLALIGIGILLPELPGSPPMRLRRRMAVLGDPKVASIVVVSFVANIASLGLYTYLAPVLKSVGHIGNPIPYLATWGIGGILGSLLIGVVIDRTRRSFSLFTVVMLAFAAAMVVVPLAGGVHALLFLPLLVWGAAGFASPAPQQEQLLAARPDNSNVVVALNDSAIYLGSAVGSALFGAVLAAGLPMSALPYVAAGFAVLGLLVHLLVVPNVSARTSGASGTGSPVPAEATAVIE
ncbi:MFS transporter [Streptomyces olivoreticuli]|uniref:MFS transporter n=1 Tax=Streptomyces olivoreticuli TaxID=68246 RepID=UPI00265844FB|nr:MFS transporter [Streptomyces olivoreticuli]WKK21560.1 MFS transporter [Streptomyces olivoreticuli]